MSDHKQRGGPWIFGFTPRGGVYTTTLYPVPFSSEFSQSLTANADTFELKTLLHDYNEETSHEFSKSLEIAALTLRPLVQEYTPDLLEFSISQAISAVDLKDMVQFYDEGVQELSKDLTVTSVSFKTVVVYTDAGLHEFSHALSISNVVLE